MQDRGLVTSIRLSEFLSYGPSAESVELGPLNVLIGPNASGKSNLIEAFSLLRAAPRDLQAPLRQGGGVREWIWKGRGGSGKAEIEVTISLPQRPTPLCYRLQFAAVNQRFEITDEAIENAESTGPHRDDVYFFYRYQHGHPALNTYEDGEGGQEQRRERRLRHEDVDPHQSVLSQRKDPELYPELTYVGNQFQRFRLYREWNLGRNTPPRLPQLPDLPSDFLAEDASNLGLVLNDLEHRGTTKTTIIEKLRRFCPAITDISTRIQGGTVQVFVHEEPFGEPIPATRLSDGTIRYLCLLSILCHPEPPPLVCIEEPEVDLHPDAIYLVADMLLEASTRTQLVVTTHSDLMVSALTDTPEAVVVCARTGNGTSLARLDAERLAKWLDDYSLGELWLSGELGGTA